MSARVRTRFAPSPTGGLHLGGVRTALYSYLYAKKHGGDFVLRIEDTDQTRFVEGAEDYIMNSLNWCGITPDESPTNGGNYGPYRQSERKESYRQFAMQLIAQGNAYYAFDTKEDLEQMRAQYKTEQNPTPQYDAKVRMHMKNSVSLPEAEVQALLAAGTPHVIRVKVPQNETITFTDLIRGDVLFDSNLIDDKVLLKADGMPTYHLAVVVDDYAMKISHAFRGEEWLPSAPVHLLLWQYLGWQNDMPQWAHLPLILKPDGNGKLSKRDGERLGFPVFSMDWTDPTTNEKTVGFKERGYLPQAFVNILAMLGWNDSTDKELFSMQELIEHFDIARVHKGGAKFNIEKALWYNAEYVKQLDEAGFENYVLPHLQNEHKTLELASGKTPFDIFNLVKDRCTFTLDIVPQTTYFYEAPKQIALEHISAKWTAEKANFFRALIATDVAPYTAEQLQLSFNALAAEHNIKPGELQLPMRIMLVGDKFGPTVFLIAEALGQVETNARIERVLGLL
jgi:glutamyl-tRNA synthetase